MAQIASEHMAKSQDVGTQGIVNFPPERRAQLGPDLRPQIDAGIVQHGTSALLKQRASQTSFSGRLLRTMTGA